MMMSLIISDEERAEMAKAPFDEDAYKKVDGCG